MDCVYSKADLEKAVKQHGSQRKAAKALGFSQTTFHDHLSGRRGGEAKPSMVKTGAVGKSIADFRAQHDKSFIIPKRIKEGLAMLGSGWEYELAFAKLAGVSLGDLGNYREQFAEFYIVIGRDSKRAWTGSKATAEAMRAMVR